MATALKELDVGSLVKLRENGLPVEFIVAKHDYESERNGARRTLLVRKETCGLMLWHNADLNLYAGSDVDVWLNGAYLDTLDKWLLKHIGETKIPYVIGNNVNRNAELQRSVFLLSLTEFGLANANVTETGTALPSAGELLVARYYGAAAHQWTRSPMQNAVTNVAYVTTGGAANNTACTNESIYVRPAFTVPGEKLFVLDDGTVEGNFVTISGGKEALGEKAGTFSLSYSVTTNRGSAATVTERVYGKVIRSYTAVSGEEQTATVNTAMVPDGSHALTITAESDTGETAEKVCPFTVKPFARKGGTVQELQDEMGEPVFPVTMARAVLTEDGRSVQDALDAPLPEKYELGDIRYSVKAGLGDEWLLCNGELVLKRDYPKLAELLTHSGEINTEIGRENVLALEVLDNNYGVYGCEGGRVFIMHNERMGTGLTHVSILGEDGKWETHKLVGLDAPPVVSGTGNIRYSGGRFFFLEKVNAVTKEAGRKVYISDDLITWEAKMLTFDESFTGIMSDLVLAPGGQVMALVQHTEKTSSSTKYYVQIGYAASLEDTITNIKSCSSTVAFMAIAKGSYAEGKFFMNFSNGSANYLVSCNAETGEVSNHVSTGDTATTVATPAVYCDGFYYVAVGSTLGRTEDGETWKFIKIATVSPAYFSTLGATEIDGRPTVVICSYHATSSTANLIQLVDVETFRKVGEKSLCFAVLDGAFGLVFDEKGLRLYGNVNKSIKVGTATVYTKSITVREYDGLHGFRLPMIAADGAYAYIKAKEVEA